MFLFVFSLNFFVQWLILDFQLLLQAQIHFLLLFLPLFVVHFSCLILLYIVFLIIFSFLLFKLSFSVSNKTVFSFNCLFSLKNFWYTVIVKFKSLTYSWIVLCFVCNDNWKFDKSFLKSIRTTLMCCFLVFWGVFCYLSGSFQKN